MNNTSNRFSGFSISIGPPPNTPRIDSFLLSLTTTLVASYQRNSGGFHETFSHEYALDKCKGLWAGAETQNDDDAKMEHSPRRRRISARASRRGPRRDQR